MQWNLYSKGLGNQVEQRIEKRLIRLSTLINEAMKLPGVKEGHEHKGINYKVLNAS